MNGPRRQRYKSDGETTSTFKTLLDWLGRQPERAIIIINMEGTKIDSCFEHYEKAIDFVWGLH